MLIVIERFLEPEAVSRFRSELARVSWEDGVRSTAGPSVLVKHNRQAAKPETNALANELLSQFGRHPLFMSAALPHRIYPPRFNRYGEGEQYGTHVDASIMPLPGSADVVRSDISVTVFLSDAADYDGGELVIEQQFGAQEVKLDAGDLVLYPSSSLHRVNPVTRGERMAAITWLQSMVPDTTARDILFDLDQSIQALSRKLPANHPQIRDLGATYHNLVRRWARV